jgi:hypothetical protein
VLVLLILMVLLSLVPLSPLKIGYALISSPRSNGGVTMRVYADTMIAKLPETGSLGAVGDSIEEGCGLTFNRDFSVYLCRDKSECARIWPFFRTDASGFAFGGFFVVLNRDVMETLGYSLEEIVRHESTHILLSQNMGIVELQQFSKTGNWLWEGPAVYMQGRIMIDEKDFKRQLAACTISYGPESSNISVNPKNHRFEYALYGYFMRYLVGRFGHEAFVRLVREIPRMHADGDRVFREVYGEDPNAVLRSFLDKTLQGE